jgi:hypothetical protein
VWENGHLQEIIQMHHKHKKTTANKNFYFFSDSDTALETCSVSTEIINASFSVQLHLK